MGYMVADGGSCGDRNNRLQDALVSEELWTAKKITPIHLKIDINS